MLGSERDRIFNDWLAGHKGILFKVAHAYAFEHADRQDLVLKKYFDSHADDGNAIQDVRWRA